MLPAPCSPEMELAMRVVAACVVACEMGMESKAAIGSDRSVHRTSLALIEMHCGLVLASWRLRATTRKKEAASRLDHLDDEVREKSSPLAPCSPLADAAFFD